MGSYPSPTLASACPKLWVDPDIGNPMHNIEVVAFDGEFKVAETALSLARPTLCATFGVPWMCEATRRTLSWRTATSSRHIHQVAPPNESKQSFGCLDGQEVVQSSDCHAEGR